MNFCNCTKSKLYFVPCRIYTRAFFRLMACFNQCRKRIRRINSEIAHGGGRVVSASGSETSVSSSTPTSAIIYDAYTSITKKKIKKIDSEIPLL